MRALISGLAGLCCLVTAAAAQDVALAPGHTAERGGSADMPRGTSVHIPLVQHLLADPAIRDFVGLGENQWNFNAPDHVPGFAAMPADDAQNQVAAAGSGD